MVLHPLLVTNMVFERILTGSCRRNKRAACTGHNASIRSKLETTLGLELTIFSNTKKRIPYLE